MMSEQQDVKCRTVKMRDLTFDESLFISYKSNTLLDNLLSTYGGFPKGVNYMIIGDPGVGKTTIILDFLANVQINNPNARILFISVEMNEIDLIIYMQRYPKFQDLNILFIESDYDIKKHNWEIISEIVDEGWDIIAIDSFHELQGVVKEEENIRMREAEGMILSFIKKQNKAQNERKRNTSFLTIQQVTKSGAFVGTNRLKHMITAMMELRLENPRNVYSNRYALFSKHRRGDVGVRLYYSLNVTGDVLFDNERYIQDQRIQEARQNISTRMHELTSEFDNLFNQ